MTEAPGNQVKHVVEAVRAAEPEHRETLLPTLDRDLRKEVGTLLDAEDDTRQKSITVETSTAIKPLSPDTETPDRIGPYQVLREIGEGGMRIVYEAEQEKAVRRTVALKLIKWGMGEAGDSKFRIRATGLGPDEPPEHRECLRRRSYESGPSFCRPLTKLTRWNPNEACRTTPVNVV